MNSRNEHAENSVIEHTNHTNTSGRSLAPKLPFPFLFSKFRTRPTQFTAASRMAQKVEVAQNVEIPQKGEMNDIDEVAANFPGEPLRRNLGPFTAAAVGFNIVNAMVGIGSSLAVAVAAGGTVTIIYGVIVAGFAYVCVGASLAEMVSVFPTAGGQYHFAAILASPKRSKSISYVCGIVSIFSWVATCAAATILMAEAILAIPSYFVNGYNPPTWHYFLVYQAVNVVYLLNNIFFLKRSPWMHDFGCEWFPFL